MLEPKSTWEGRWADRVVGLDGVRVDVAMMRTPDGHGRLELMKLTKYRLRYVRGPEGIIVALAEQLS